MQNVFGDARKRLDSHVLGDGRVCHVVAEKRELRSDHGRSPGRVLHRHAPDQVNQLHADRRPAGLRARLPLPVIAEALPVPSDDRVGPHEVDGITPLSQHPLHQDPEHAVAVLDLRALDRSLEHGELMAQRDVLECEPLAVFDEKPEEEDETP